MPDSLQSVSFDRMAHRYDDTRGYAPSVSERIASALLARGSLTAGSQVLEIGIGTGRIAIPLLARGVCVTGVDISPLMVERLRQNVSRLRAEQSATVWGDLRVEMADMTALPFADASFDAAVAVHVMHLVPAWRQALTEVLRVVRPGGCFLLGQDMTDERIRSVIQQQWLTILRWLGYEPPQTGASGHLEVLDELRARGLPLDITTPVTWEQNETPRDALNAIVTREWSRTWNVPDDLFAESVARLEDWTQRTYGDVLDTPVTARCSFKVARVIRP